ncbi:MAG: alpha-amylase [Desulfuromonas sp.]|nr:alpha-amylase [Desulfuromonas sp.]
MTSWPLHPLIYEINTWVWLEELGRGMKTPVTLATVPKKEWDAIAALGVDAVWLMGVWERSPAGIRIAMGNEGLLADFRRALHDFTAADNVGSPYCVRNYAVDPHLGGSEGLATARRELARRGLRLILDFVPNHMAPDHPWVIEHPDYFIRGSTDDLARDPAAFFETAGQVIACGRDPFFPAWPDVLQLNAFNAGLRAATAATVNAIAGQCDGVRCDMAMLMMNDIFQRTWGERAGDRPEQDYWPELIGAVRAKHPGFLFMAEAYWDLEWQLQQQGFDYCYDKQLYDRLEHGPAPAVRGHLQADMTYQEKLVRFIENHDEPRAAAAFPAGRQRAAAVTALTLPGAKLLHEGQLTGRTVRLPVFLGRRPDEPADEALQAFYRLLLTVAAAEPLRSGVWRLCSVEGWPDNRSCENLVAWCWQSGGERCLIVVNLSAASAQGRVQLSWDDLVGRRWQMRDLSADQGYECEGAEIAAQGLYVELPPWGHHLLAGWQSP